MNDGVAYQELRRLAEAGDVARFLAEVRDLHPSDLSDVLASLDGETQLKLVQTLPADIVSDALAEMEDEEHPEAVLAALPSEKAADIVDELADDDAVDLIAELPTDKAARILASVADRADIERLLLYDEDTAGGKMTSAVVAVQDSATAAAAIEAIRKQAAEAEDFYQVYCVDDSFKLVGILPLQGLVVADPMTKVATIMEPPLPKVTADLDQEEVAQLMARYNVPAVPVVSHFGKLLGRVTFDDVMDVLEKETTEDILKFGGAPPDEQLAGAWHQAVRNRLPWLYVNLLTAFLAGAVVFLFQNAIVRVSLLAVMMPIIAGMGGNAGTQALAVTVRRIAVGMIPVGQGWKVIGKEFFVGMVNGIAVGVVLGLVAAVVGQGWQLGLVVVLAMWGNLVLGTAAGAAMPLLLQKLGVDPAVASSVLVTTFTDVFGFGLLLGLAALLLLPGT